MPADMSASISSMQPEQSASDTPAVPAILNLLTVMPIPVIPVKPVAHNTATIASETNATDTAAITFHFTIIIDCLFKIYPQS